MLTITTPQMGIMPEGKLFPAHSLGEDVNLLYIGTHFQMDVYVEEHSGNLYAVYGVEPHEYYSSVGYSLVRTNRAPESVPAYVMAAAAALLRNPQHIEKVMKAHL